jgi:hypothetical protein
MEISPTAREATLPASSVKDQTAALFLEGAADDENLSRQCELFRRSAQNFQSWFCF